MNYQKLKAKREYLNLTGLEISDELNLTPIAYYRKEAGGKFYVKDVLVIIKLFKLTPKEFVEIFFDGYLPKRNNYKINYNFESEVEPVKVARLRAGVSDIEIAKALNINSQVYYRKEHAPYNFTIQECYALTKLFCLTFKEVDDIFFKSQIFTLKF